MSYAEKMLQSWAEKNKLRAAGMKEASALDRNLEAWLNGWRQANYILGFKPEITEDVADFTTGDFLGMTRSGKKRNEFLAEFSAYPDFLLREPRFSRSGRESRLHQHGRAADCGFSRHGRRMR